MLPLKGDMFDVHWLTGCFSLAKRNSGRNQSCESGKNIKQIITSAPRDTDNNDDVELPGNRIDERGACSYFQTRTELYAEA